MNNVHNQRRTSKKKKVKKKSKAAKSQEKTNRKIQDEAAKRSAQKAVDDAVKKAAKTVKDAVELCDFPKIATDAKIQGAGYDSTSGSFVKLKDLSFTSGQLERLIAIAQDGKARVRITIEEINPTFDTASKKKPPADMFEGLDKDKVDAGVSKAVEKATDKKDTKKAKKTSKKKDAKGGSQLPI